MQKMLTIALLVILLVPVVTAQYEFRFKDEQRNFLQTSSVFFQGMYLDQVIMYFAVFLVFFTIFWQGIKRIGFEKKIGLVLAMALSVIATIPTMKGVTAPRFSGTVSGLVPQELLALALVAIIGLFVYKVYDKFKDKDVIKFELKK